MDSELITKREYEFDLPQLNGKKHKFIAYSMEGDQLLHYSSRFGYTDFSREIDTHVIANIAQVIDLEGNVIKNKRPTKVEGRELIVYNDDGSIKFDEWVYVDRTRIVPVLFDIDGYELYF